MPFQATFRHGLAIAASVLSPALVACQASRLDANLIESLTTTVAPASIAAGATAEVRCTAHGPAARWLEAGDFSATLVPETGPAEGATLAGMTVTGTKVGTYRAFCALADYHRADAVGAVLTVVAGAPVTTRVVLGTNPVQMGHTSTVSCMAVDAFGNEWTVDAPQYTAPPQLAFANGVVEPSEVGTYSVTCGAPNDGATHTPSQLVVLPGDPVRLELTADPARVVYGTDAVVNLSWTAYDAYENPIEDLPGTLTAPTNPSPELVDDALHRYRLADEGHYLFSVRLAAPWQALTDDLELIVDVTAPRVTITFPPRGATILKTADPVTVQGNVFDAGGLSHLFINGAEVAVDADGDFAHPVDSVWGLNMLIIEADDIASLETRLTPTYQYSDGWTDFVDENASNLKIPDSLAVLLGQNFFDDGQHDPAHIDDIATLLELVFGTVDIKSLIDTALAGLQLPTVPLGSTSQTIDIIPDALWVELQFNGVLTLTLTSAETTGLAPAHVTIDSRTGGLDWSLTFGDATRPAFALDLVFAATATFTVTSQTCVPIFGCTPNPTVELVGSATATGGAQIGTFNVDVGTDMAKAFGQPSEIAFTHFDSSAGDIHIAPIEDIVFHVGLTGIPGLSQTIDIPLSDYVDLGALMSGFLDPLAQGIADLVPALLNPLIEAVAGPLLSGLFDMLVIDTTIPLPSLLGNGVTAEIGLATELSTIAFTDDGDTTTVAVGLYSDKGVERDPLGAIQRKDCLGTSTAVLNWAWDPSVGIGVRTDLINAAFFAAWWTGYLNGPVDLATLLGGGALPIPVDNLQLTLNWLLPPIVNDCIKGPIQAQIGDLGVTLTGTIFGFDVSVDLFVDMGLGVNFVTGPDGVSLELSDVLGTDMEIIAIDDGGLGDIFDLRSIIESALPGLLGGFLSGQTFGPIALPATDLSTIIPTLPPGTTLGLGNLSVKTQSGYVVLGGDLE